MFQIIGVVVVFVMVFGGFMLAGGHFDVIIKAAPFEMMMIGGAADRRLPYRQFVQDRDGRHGRLRQDHGRAASGSRRITPTYCLYCSY